MDTTNTLERDVWSPPRPTAGRRTDTQQGSRFGSMLVGIALCTGGLVGCSDGNAPLGEDAATPTRESDEAPAEAPRPSTSREAPDFHGEDFGRPSVAVSWEAEGPAFEAASLRAIIHNRTTDAIEVELHVSMADLDGTSVRSELGRHAVAPQSDLPVRLASDELPIQSTEVSVPMTVVATYALDRPAILGSETSGSTRQQLQTHATPWHVTFERSDGIATFRSATAQAAKNAEASVVAPTRHTGALDADDTALVDGSSAPERARLAAALSGQRPAAAVSGDTPGGNDTVSFVDLPFEVLSDAMNSVHLQGEN